MAREYTKCRWLEMLKKHSLIWIGIIFLTDRHLFPPITQQPFSLKSMYLSICMEGKPHALWIMSRGNRGCSFPDKLTVNLTQHAQAAAKYMYMHVVKNDLGRYGKCWCIVTGILITHHFVCVDSITTPKSFFCHLQCDKHVSKNTMNITVTIFVEGK